MEHKFLFKNKDGSKGVVADFDFICDIKLSALVERIEAYVSTLDFEVDKIEIVKK